MRLPAVNYSGLKIPHLEGVSLADARSGRFDQQAHLRGVSWSLKD